MIVDEAKRIQAERDATAVDRINQMVRDRMARARESTRPTPEAADAPAPGPVPAQPVPPAPAPAAVAAPADVPARPLEPAAGGYAPAALTVGARVRFTKGKRQGTVGTVTAMLGDRPVVRGDDGTVMGGNAGLVPGNLEVVNEPAATPAQADQPMAAPGGVPADPAGSPGRGPEPATPAAVDPAGQLPVAAQAPAPAVSPAEELDRLESKYRGPFGPANQPPAPGTAAWETDHARMDELRTAMGRQLWQRTSAQVKASHRMPVEAHRKLVEKAMREGKPVPAEVLAEHGLTPAPSAAKDRQDAQPAAPQAVAEPVSVQQRTEAQQADQAVVNLPLGKRGAGSLDAQIDRGLAEERRRKEKADAAAGAKTRDMRAAAKAARDRISALPDESLADLAARPDLTITVAKGRGTVEVHPAIHALAVFKNIAERERHVAQTLGKDYKTWRDVADMNGLQAWQPEEGLQLVPGWAAVDDQITKALRSAGINEAEVQESLPDAAPVAGTLRRSLVVMGKKPEWLIPAELAAQLNDMRRAPTDNTLTRFAEAATRRWKLWMLHQPLRVLKYQINNLVGDLDVALTEPGFIKQVARERFKIARDMADFVRGKPLDRDTEAQMREAQRLGLLDSGISAAELPDVDRLPALRALFGKGWSWSWAGMPEAARRYFDTAQRFGRWREGVTRIAMARHLYGQISPSRRRYAGSRKDEMDQLYDRWAGLTGEIEQIDRRKAPSDADLIRRNALADESRQLKARIAAKLARELIGDYGNLSHNGQVLRRTLIPFWSWAEINAPRYLRIVKNARYEGEGGTARAFGASVAFGAGLGIRMAALTAMVFAFNAAMKAALGISDEEDPNKDNDLSKLVIITGRNEDGTVTGIRVAGALVDALGWLNLNNAAGSIETIRDGMREGQTAAAARDVLGDTITAPVNRLVQGVTPIIKVAAEQISGRKWFPDIRDPRPLGDRWAHLADAAAVGSVYRWQTEQSGGGKILESMLFVEHDPRSAAVFRIRDQVEEWAGRNGVPLNEGGGEPKPRGIALRQARAAFANGDQERAMRWMDRYFGLGGRPMDLAKSKAGMHPLRPLSNRYRADFVKSLDAEDKAALTRAIDQWRDWWDKPDEGFRAMAMRAWRARMQQRGPAN